MTVLIIGAGGHGQVVADILAASLNGPQPGGFLDDNPALQGRTFLGLLVLGPVAQLAAIPHQAVVVAIGHNRTRQQLCRQLLAAQENLISALHPTVIIGRQVSLGPGTTASAGVIINPGAQIGQGVILNTGCTVDHHNCLGDYVHIAPGAHLGGDVEVGPGVLVGIGATVLPQRRIGAWSIVGAGAVVTADVPAYSIVVGNPARVIKTVQPDNESYAV